MSGSQKFIARNRAPRVQIEYDVELYGATKKVQLPFVMGVMSDLSGKTEQPPVADRKFLEIDVDNFDERMRAIAPRASFTVPNTLAGEGNLAVDLTFEKMEDFSPQAIAAKVNALAPLLEARRQLADLLAYMDGKSRAEALIENLLTAPELLRALVGGGEDTADMDAALATLKARMPEPEPQDDGADRTLAELDSRAPQDAPKGRSVDDVLGRIERREAAAEENRTSDVLAGIERQEDIGETDKTAEILSGIERREDVEETDDTSAVLAGLERRDDVPETDQTGDILAGIERSGEHAEVDATAEILAAIEHREAAVEEDRTGGVLASMERREEAEETDDTSAVLAGIQRREDAPEEDGTKDVLAAIERRDDGEDADADEAADVLAGIARSEDVMEPDDMSDVLAGIERREEEVETDATYDILASLEPVAADPQAADDLDDILAGLEPAEASQADEDNSGDVLEGLKDRAPVQVEPDRTDDILAALDAPEPEPAGDTTKDVLASQDPAEQAAPDSPTQGDGLADLGAGADTETVDSASGDLGDDAEGNDAEVRAGREDLDTLLAGFGEDAAATAHDGVGQSEPGDPEEMTAAATDDLDALLADLGGTDDAGETVDAARDVPAPAASDVDAEENDLDALLADLGGTDHTTTPDVDAPDATPEPAAVEDDLDALLAGLDAADDTTAPEVDAPDATQPTPEPAASEDDLDALLADLGASEVGDVAPEPDWDREALPGETDTGQSSSGANGDTHEDTTLDDLLAELGAAEVGQEETHDDLDALLSDLTADVAPPESTDAGAGDDLDALLADIGAADLGEATAEAPQDVDGPEMVAAPAPEQARFGTISAPQPERESMNRDRFRMAIFGDFTGRSARGLMETGTALAARKPILLDVDTVEDVIESFATTLTLPIGKDDEGIEVTLGGLDDLHPDELYDNVEIFDAISGLRQQLGVGSMAAKTTERLKEWAQEFGTPVRLPKRSAATSVPPDLKLSDFQALIGDTRGTLTKATPADDLIARIVGPHVVKAPDVGAAEMLKAVDEALSAAMRLVLHHPDFQAVESQWRSLDLLARRIETDTSLQIVLYDVSAEEMAADLSAQEDLAQSGLYRLLTDVMDPEEGDGGFSALFGLYTFEETPPHAELLARIGLVAAHVDAPFFAAITPAYLETPKEDRHKLVAEAWDTLRAQPQAAWLGLASPRFLLRQPYGAKSDPCYAFEFEEFTPKEGLKGLLWANPVVLVAILLAATWKKDGRAMNLGGLMSLGELPFTYVNDRYGDQVALPCTERNLTSDPAQATLARGYMPVLWIKGRNEIRLGSFRSLAGSEIAGPWSSEAPARPAPPQATLEMDIQAEGASGGGASGEGEPGAAASDDPLADLDRLLDSGDSAESGDGLDLLGSGDDDDGQSLDDLLASFADDDDGAGDDDDMDPELAALLEGL